MNPALLLSRCRTSRLAAALLAFGLGGCASPDHQPLRVPLIHNWATWHQLWRAILDSPVSPLKAARGE